ncbi:GyrI-like domain-containing protein [Streptacidiphilus carbonis]|jgi:effector-binding domain-containing protein|uniref:GyrI-like domain-containing protein n=1 Tax=Streptacidiphilus carbonis TaxID=105422 RepID=UPI0005AABDC4|nr:GyrI-like domain-containing protein [Streptacidiphilus carbonis]
MNADTDVPLVIVERAAQPYAGVRAVVAMESVDTVAHRIPEVIGRLAALGVAPAGAPFLKYDVIDMERGLEVEAGVPVAGPAAEGEGDLFFGVLPGGRYALHTHVGGFDGLVGATALLLERAAAAGLRWDMVPTEAGDRWGCRIESYLTDPRTQPDSSKWETELAFRLADDE